MYLNFNFFFAQSKVENSDWFFKFERKKLEMLLYQLTLKQRQKELLISEPSIS